MRNILPQEIALVRHLLALSNDDRPIPANIQSVTVLQDGAMGSIRFAGGQDRKYGRDITQVKYIDSDNQQVLITLIADALGDLFELEFWKVDFKPLIQYPTPDKVFIIENSST